MRYVLLLPVLAFGLAGCYSSHTVEKPVVVQPAQQAPGSVVVPAGGATVVCPNGTTVPAGNAC